MLVDEGYTKYNCHWLEGAAPPDDYVRPLTQWRNRLYKLGLIGEYENGIGFGNLSRRLEQTDHFIITGTQTGGLPTLTEQNYTLVTTYDWQQNKLTCIGPVAASSESLTHGAIYKSNQQVKAVIHVHHLELWEKLTNCVPTTAADAAYGTPEMAQEIIRLSQEGDLQKAKILVMSGHLEGIIVFGASLAEAGNLLLEYYQNLTNCQKMV